MRRRITQREEHIFKNRLLTAGTRKAIEAFGYRELRAALRVEMKLLKVLTLLFVIVGGAFIAIAWRPSIAAVDLSSVQNFDAPLVKRGAQLAALGNCTTCHTAPGGPPFAGGVALPTPFGVIYSTNITPEAESGIGGWSELAFRRAMREGVDREGRHLYPAFPYDHFTMLTDTDIAALYAYFMGREPVYAKAPPNEVSFPLNFRPLIAGWKLLFLHAGPYRLDPKQSDAWNRGAYLIEGLAHCGGCHTPRNTLGAEKSRRKFAGGDAEGWTAYALDASSPAPVPWDAEALQIYLRSGWHDHHGLARGPMAPIIDNLTEAESAQDLQAMTVYLMGFLGEPGAERRRAGQSRIDRVRIPPSLESQTVGQGGTSQDAVDGEKIYQATCASCHEGHARGPFGGIDLSLSTGPSGPDARNVLNVVLWGLPPAEGVRSPSMPGFAGALTQKQLVDLLTFVRSRFSDKPAWKQIEKDVRETLSGQRSVMVHPSPGTDLTPVSE